MPARLVFANLQNCCSATSKMTALLVITVTFDVAA